MVDQRVILRKGGCKMARQLHGRLTDEQVVAIMSRYVRRDIDADQAMNMLELGRSQFFEWVKKYKSGPPSGFSTGYFRKTPDHRIGNKLEEHILDELKIEKKLVDDPLMPVKQYNYSFIRDQIMKKYNLNVSVPTIIDRAKKGASISKDRKRNITIGK
jgi:hypothetical protein